MGRASQRRKWRRGLDKHAPTEPKLGYHVAFNHNLKPIPPLQGDIRIPRKLVDLFRRGGK